MSSNGVAGLVGCGILRKEVLYLAQKNRWALTPRFASSSLHVDYDKLEHALTGMLKDAPPKTVVLYGTCHPLIDRFIAPRDARRVDAQNCIEMLLGKEAFTRELKNGAFFLLEEWALRWHHIVDGVFGRSGDDTKEILHTAHDHFLCLRTPCSSDFSAAAQALSAELEMPLEWRDVPLDNLERLMRDVLEFE